MPNVSNLVKTIQDIMRKYVGTYGDAQRLEQPRKQAQNKPNALPPLSLGEQGFFLGPDKGKADDGNRVVVGNVFISGSWLP